MKRFWETAAIEPAEGGGLRITLDGRPMNLPGGVRLVLPTQALADAVAAEWQGAGGEKGGEFGFDDVPLSRLAGTAQERIAKDTVPTALAIAEYGVSDLLCYRADQPQALVQRQAEAWQPWLDWAARQLDAPLRVTAGVMPVKQDPLALQALRRVVLAQDAWTLAGLGIAVPALGSLVLGLAMTTGALDAGEAHELASLDERFQEELWGMDEDAARRRVRIAADVALAARLIALSRPA